MNNLKYLRLQANLSLRQVSEKVKISHSTLQLLENEKRILKIETAQILADFYNVSLNFLIGETNNGIYLENGVSLSKKEFENYKISDDIKIRIYNNKVQRISSEDLSNKLIKTSSKERDEFIKLSKLLTDVQIKEVLDFTNKYILRK